MAKPLMLYGSQRHSGLIVKEDQPGKLADRLSAQLARKAVNSSAGYLIRGGGMEVSKHSGCEDKSLRLIRFNAGKA